MKNDTNIWQIRASKLFCFAVIFAALWLVLKYAAPFIAVAFLSFIVSSAVSSAASFVSQKTGLPRGLCATVILLLAFIFLSVAIVLAVIRIAEEGEELLLWLSENRGYVNGVYSSMLSKIGEIVSSLPLIGEEGEIVEYTGGILSSVINDGISFIIKKMGELLAALFHATPTAVMSGIAFVMSCFYLTLDGERIKSFIRKALPCSVWNRVSKLSGRLLCAMGRYIRAYAFILAMTFFETFVGLTVLRAEYAFLISLVVAIVDILPVLGAGIVLLPWAVFSFVTGEYGFGTGLLVLYGIITLVRQIAEPRIVGSKLGLHPFASLMLMSLGVCIFGVWGAVAAPIIGVLLKEFIYLKNSVDLSSKK